MGGDPVIQRDTLGHQSLKDLVVQRIRKAIFDGQLELGARLIETSVAEELGVSRGPVREAFLDLAKEGLLVINPRRGASLSTLAPDDIWQIYILRAHLEALLVRFGLQHFGPSDLDYLEGVVEEMGTLSDGPGEIARATALDLKFHGRIADACPYPRLREAYQALDAQVGAGIYTVVKVLPGTLTRMKAKHEPVVRALRTRDLTVAETAVQTHWIETADRIRQAMAAREGQPEGLAAGRRP
jgi:DNA-binding GntR family transcriptional regulator